jgi:4-hydroxy-2-oxoheptanedioate aldolase
VYRCEIHREGEKPLKFLKHRVQAGEVLLGTFVNLGSSLTTEIIGSAGYDWALIDLEHGAGDEREALIQMQALEHTPAVPLVRIESLNRPRFHRILDFGAAGIMVPRIDSVEQAQEVVACLRFPPRGIRGVAQMNRACQFGMSFQDYLENGESQLLGIVQIESPQAVGNAEAIAAIDGVDVLFVGPIDLSHSMGIPGQIEHPQFVDALRTVASAAKKGGKAAGILLRSPGDAARHLAMGYTFLGCGSDGSMLRLAAHSQLAELRERARNSGQ